MLPKTKQINNVRNICLLRRKIFPTIAASAKLRSKNNEFAMIKDDSALNEKEVSARAENISAGNPMLRANSFRTLRQSSPMFLNFCRNALAKIIRNSGAIIVSIWIICFDYGLKCDSRLSFFTLLFHSINKTNHQFTRRQQKYQCNFCTCMIGRKAWFYS